MKKPYRHIVPLLAISFTALLLYQAYWLLGLFRSSLESKKAEVEFALQKADYSELMERLGELSKTDDSGSINMDAGWIDEPNSAEVKVSVYSDTLNVETSSKSATLTISSGPESNSDYASTASEELANYYQRGLHAGIDAFSVINKDRLAFLLDINLSEIGVDLPHRLSIYDVEGMIEEVSTKGYIPSVKAEQYALEYGMSPEEKYILTIEPVAQVVFRGMAGVITASLLVFLMLSFSFGFLVRSMLRQKSLEEMKSDFVNNITHELKTPVAVAYAANDALLNHGASSDSDKLREYLEIGQQQLKKLEGMIEQILSIGMENRKSFELRKEAVELLPLIHSLLEQHSLCPAKRCEFSVDIPDGLRVEADRFHLGNVISNLIDNALKYSGDTVYIRISAASDEKGVKIVIQDNGIGIPPDKQKLVFDRFYRVPTGNLHDVKGYGLGLYYAKTIIEKHGGSIFLESEPGKGSVFTILFP
ncbi:MAG: HAMP domain-containing histidine kinase [Bacteroidales bacterium]|nr:HAMP domain-containing histidine kinase [Bacteroidales bacterium]